MSAEYNQCFASCPASTVTIQPPPFVLTIPGPALYCPDQPLCIEQYNPCARMITSHEGATFGGYGATSRLSASGIYSQKMQSGGQSGCNPCQRF